jgi:prepilin-type processing-associated H-X9-DG protein
MTRANSDAEVLDYMPPVRRRSVVGYLSWEVGVLFVSVLVVGGMMAVVLLPPTGRVPETANRAKCASNLSQIGKAITLYANENGGQLPPSLATVFSFGDMPLESATCPSSNDEKSDADTPAEIVADLTAAETNAPGHKPCLSYIYLGQGKTLAGITPETVLAYEPLKNHDNGGANVLFGDWHCEFIDMRTLPKIGLIQPEAATKR